MVSRRQLLGQLRMTLAGRIAEDMFTGDVSSGAGNDIETATAIARRMVCEWGMSDVVGPIRYTTEEQQLFLGGGIVQPREHSEETARVIDEEVKKLVDQASREARLMIESHRDVLDRLAEALLEREVLTADEVGLVVEGKPLAPVLANDRQAENC